MTLGLRWFGEALAGTTPLLAIPPCCATVTAGLFPTTAYDAPGIATTFASSAAVGSGMSRVLRQNGEDQPVVCWTGDGGTYDIGMATLSAAAERNEDVIYVCYDNEIYGNTGGQRSSATPMGAKTTTSAGGKAERKKDIMAIMAAHGVPYAATLSLAHHDDFVRKAKLALGLSGFRFLLMLSPCPAGWKCQPDESVDLVRMAVGCGIYPVFEVFDGVRYRVNVRPDGTPLEDYLSRQKRFKSGALDADVLRADISARWTQLQALEVASPAEDEECAAPEDVPTWAVPARSEVCS
jgi:pyruvate ferredoxin oxidoreductase beta subunit/2-oxoisovalerate ferredoxin oxidoreductase beta subunit